MHWKYKGKNIKTIEDIPEGALGFIYKITNKSKKGKYYIGRKTAVSLRKLKLTKKDKLLPENKRKKFKYVPKESDWKKYWGSSKYLLEDIEAGDKCTREILRFCFSKAELSYYELEAIVCSGALLDTEGNYNFWVSAKVYSAHLLKTKNEK